MQRLDGGRHIRLLLPLILWSKNPWSSRHKLGRASFFFAERSCKEKNKDKVSLSQSKAEDIYEDLKSAEDLKSGRVQCAQSTGFVRFDTEINMV